MKTILALTLFVALSGCTALTPAELQLLERRTSDGFGTAGAGVWTYRIKADPSDVQAGSLHQRD